MTTALGPLLQSSGPLALALAMVVVFAETGLLVGFFLPGDSLLFSLGVLAAAGALRLPFWLLAAGLFIAAVAGDQVGYLVGRRLGPRVFRRTDSRFFAASHARRAQFFFARHGPPAVVLARFVPVVRTFTPVVAGVAAMPRRAFATYNAVGGLAWTVGLLAAGWFLGGVPVVAAHLDLFVIGVVALTLVPASVGLARSRVGRWGRSRGDGGTLAPAKGWTRDHVDRTV